MKISDLYSQNARMDYISKANSPSQTEKTQPSQEAKESPSAQDRVDLSDQSKEMQKVYEVLQMTPDVRAEKVAQLKTQIEDGKYQVSSEDVADKMLKDSLLELL